MGTWRSKNCSPVTCDAVVLDAGTMVRWRAEMEGKCINRLSVSSGQSDERQETINLFQDLLLVLQVCVWDNHNGGHVTRSQ